MEIRAYRCNTICPVGTLLGFLSRYSLFKVRIDAEKCNHCGLCATKCKASCINSPEQTIDYSRCIDCFDCLGECRQNALSYTISFKTKKQVTDASKRRFFACRADNCRRNSQSNGASSECSCGCSRNEK